MIRFVHAADLHLGRPMQRLQHFDHELKRVLTNAVNDSFQHLIETAINEKVDFVVFSGDIYDQPTGALADQLLFKQGMEQLADAEIPVYLIFGNHDYTSLQDQHVDLPDNVHIFPETVDTLTLETKSGERVALSGFSYTTQWITDDRVADFPMRNQAVDYHIGLLHGAAYTGETTRDRYAPFKPADLAAHQYDYWALGHIHGAHRVLDDNSAWYAGNIQGTRANEVGAKGALLVTIERHRQPTVEPFETTDWQFYPMTVPLDAVSDMEGLRMAIEQAMRKVEITASDEQLNLLADVTLQVTSDDGETIATYHRYATNLANEVRRRYLSKYHNGGSDRYGHVMLFDLHLALETAEEAVALLPYEQKMALQRIETYRDPEVFETLIEPLLKHSVWVNRVWAQIDHEQMIADVVSYAEQRLLMDDES
ncbi:MAG: DNA repair exonuclease [Aerococcus sp.]|nr:DNA repair exonuclease [Aerococcus sp.]